MNKKMMLHLLQDIKDLGSIVVMMFRLEKEILL